MKNIFLERGEGERSDTQSENASWGKEVCMLKYWANLVPFCTSILEFCTGSAFHIFKERIVKGEGHQNVFPKKDFRAEKNVKILD